MLRLFHCTSVEVASIILQDGFVKSPFLSHWLSTEAVNAGGTNQWPIVLEVDIKMTEAEKVAFRREVYDREIDPDTHEPLGDSKMIVRTGYEIPTDVLKDRVTGVRLFSESSQGLEPDQIDPDPA